MSGVDLTGRRFPKTRWIVLLVACIYAAMFVHIEWWPKSIAQVLPSPENTVHAVTVDDLAVYQAFLTRVRAVDSGIPSSQGPLEVTLPTHKGDPLVVVTETVIGNDIGSLDRFTHMDRKLGRAVPYDDQYNLLRRQLLARNARSVSIPHFATPIPVKFGETLFGPRNRCDMFFSLPVYSIGKSTALVYFYSRSDSSEDAGCIYVLHRHGNSWSVDDMEWTGCGFATVDN